MLQILLAVLVTTAYVGGFMFLGERDDHRLGILGAAIIAVNVATWLTIEFMWPSASYSIFDLLLGRHTPTFFLFFWLGYVIVFAYMGGLSKRFLRLLGSRLG